MQPAIFARITKVDEAKREVWGRAAEEIADKADEIFDYDTSKPYFKSWSDEFVKATDGKSFGNLRSMHRNVAAGKLIALDFNDAAKAMDIGTKIVDNEEWAKVLEGVYTGFSIGGSYVGEKKAEKIDGRDVRRYTAKPSEISLVDSPCMPTAKFFDIVKADGSTLQKLFKGAEPEPEAAAVDDAKATDPAPAKADGDDVAPVIAAATVIEVTGTDEQVAEFGKVLNDAGLTLGEAIDIVRKAGEAKKNPPDPVVEPEPAAPDPVAEMIVTATKAADIATRVNDPELSVIALAKIAEAELTDEERAPLKSLDDVKAAIIAKAGARHSAADRDRLQAAHDHLVGLGAECSASKAEPDGDLSKATPALVVDADALQKSLNDALDRIKALEAQPMPRPGTVQLRTVSKTQDTTAGGDDGVLFTEADLLMNDDGTVNTPASLVKLSQRLGGRPAHPAR